MKWRHWSICTRKGWRRTDASPVWWVYTILISSVTRQVGRSGLQRREAQKQIWHSRAQGYFLITCAKLILCSSRYLGLFYVFETIFQSRYHYDEDRFILSMISQILQGEIGHDKKTLETDNTINDHGCIIINLNVQYSACIKSIIKNLVFLKQQKRFRL